MLASASVIFILGPIALLFTGFLIWRAWRKRTVSSISLIFVPLPLIVALFLYTFSQERKYWEGVDLNPPVLVQDVVGTWSRNGESMSFDVTGEGTRSNGSTFHWRFDSDRLLVNDEEWAFIGNRGQLSIMPTRGMDPDNWPIHSGFLREVPADRGHQPH